LFKPQSKPQVFDQVWVPSQEQSQRLQAKVQTSSKEDLKDKDLKDSELIMAVSKEELT